MSRKRKNLLSLLLLAAILFICIVLYIFIPQGSDEQTEEQTSEETTQEDITLASVSSDEVIKLQFEKKGKVQYTLIKSGEKWKIKENPTYPVDKDVVVSALGCLEPVTASKKLENVAEPAEYGLDKPLYTLKVTVEEKVYQFDFGVEVPVEGGYYGMNTENQNVIYCMPDSIISDFDVEANMWVERDELPQPDEEKMTYVSVETQKGTILEAHTVKKSKRVDESQKWNITKPYEKAQAPDSDGWSSVLGYFNSLTYGELVSYEGGNYEKYGLENPSAVITVKYKKSGKRRSFVLCVGKKKGDFYYVRQKGKKSVYQMDTSQIENMTKINAYDVISQNVYDAAEDTIQGFDIYFGKKKLSTPRKKTEENDVWKLHEKISELKYSGEAVKRRKKQKEVLKIVYHEKNKDVTIKFYPYDGVNFYRIEKDGFDGFVVDKRNVDDLIVQLKKIEDIKE